MTQRNLEAELKARAEGPEFLNVVFIELDFPSGTVRAHNAIGTYEWGGYEWLGVGAFGSISDIEESLKLVDQPITLGLSSITPEILNAIKNDNVFNRTANIYVGVISRDNKLLATPHNWISGYMESAAIGIGEENGISVRVQTYAARLRQRNNRRYTDEDHQEFYPGDVFFNLLSAIKEAEVPWGIEASVGSGFAPGGSTWGNNVDAGNGGRTRTQQF